MIHVLIACGAAVYVAGLLLMARWMGPVRLRRRWDWNGRNWGESYSRQDAPREARGDTALLAVFWPITLVPTLVIMFCGRALKGISNVAGRALVWTVAMAARPVRWGYRWALADPIDTARDGMPEGRYREGTYSK